MPSLTIQPLHFLQAVGLAHETNTYLPLKVALYITLDSSDLYY